MTVWKRKRLRSALLVLSEVLLTVKKVQTPSYGDSSTERGLPERMICSSALSSRRLSSEMAEQCKAMLEGLVRAAGHIGMPQRQRVKLSLPCCEALLCVHFAYIRVPSYVHWLICVSCVTLSL